MNGTLPGLHGGGAAEVKLSADGQAEPYRTVGGGAAESCRLSIGALETIEDMAKSSERGL